MTKEEIYIDNVKAMATTAYNYQCMANDPECPDPEQYKKVAEHWQNLLIGYIKSPQSGENK